MLFKNAVPVLATADVRATIGYYVRVLGFEEHFVFGEPPVYAGIRRDQMLLYITRDEAMVAAIRESRLAPDVFLWVEDVDAVFAKLKSRGANVIEEPSDRPWDARQFVIEDPNGYRLKIAEPLDEIDER